MNKGSNTLHIKNSLIAIACKLFITYGKRNFLRIVLLSVAIFLAGCAGTAGRHRALMPMTVTLNQFSNLVLTSENSSEVHMLDIEHQRIVATIVHKIREKDSSRFTRINSESNMPNTLHATLMFTRYDKGNAFARSMMIGLGQIHINANLELKDGETQKVIGKYEIKKTFAWGGIYGGGTTIEGVVDGFADAVVEVLFEEE